MKRRAKVKKSPLTKRHMMLRLKFSKQYKNYSIENWEHATLSNERKINRFGSDGKK